MIRTACLALLLGAVAAPSDAAMFVGGADPTTTFSNLLIDDVTMGSGQDTGTNTVFNPARNLDIPTGLGPVDVSITGIALNPRGGTSINEETVTVEITYFGADNNFGLSGDNVVLGSRTATLQYLGAVDQYTAVFDTPITGQIDGVEDRFRIGISSTGNLRFKQWNTVQSPSGEGGLKVSVGGTATLAIPEPTTATLAVLLTLTGVLRTRR